MNAFTGHLKPRFLYITELKEKHGNIPEIANLIYRCEEEIKTYERGINPPLGVNSPLHHAVRDGMPAVFISKIMNCGADINEQNSFGENVIHLCLRFISSDYSPTKEKNYKMLFDDLIKYGANKDCRDNAGKPPFFNYLPKFSAQKFIFNLIDEYKVNFVAKDHENNTILHNLAKNFIPVGTNEPDELMGFVICKGVNINDINHQQNTALMENIIADYDLKKYEQTIYLIHAGTDLSVINKDGNTVKDLIGINSLNMRPSNQRRYNAIIEALSTKMIPDSSLESTSSSPLVVINNARTPT